MGLWTVLGRMNAAARFDISTRADADYATSTLVCRTELESYVIFHHSCLLIRSPIYCAI